MGENMTVEEIQARHASHRADISKGFYVNDAAHFDREWLLSDRAKLTQELAEERAACKIAGHAMYAMRATIERKDEEIRLLRDVVNAWSNMGEKDGAADILDSAESALSAFDEDYNA
jgi:hypothetical protein